MKRPLPFVVILLAFVCLSIGYVINTPYRTGGIVIFQGGAESKDIGAPDERQHANFVARLLEGKGLPVLDPADLELYENYQAHQPPLYYFAAAAFSKIVGADPKSPETGGRLRFLSTLFGLGTLVGLYFLIRWGEGKEEIALAGMSIGLMPMFVGLSSAVSNDPLLYLCITWSVALAVKAMKQGGDWKSLVALGIVTAAAFTTKTTSLALIPVLITGLALAWKSDKGQKLVIGGGLALALVLASPVWLRNMSLYGDPFALKVFQSSFGGSAQASMFIEAGGALSYWTQWVAWWTTRSLIGVFGYMDIYLFESLGRNPDGSQKFDQIYLALAFVFGVILLLGALADKLPKSGPQMREDDDEEDQKAAGFQWPLVVLGVVVLLLFIQFNRTYFQGQGRYLYPALPFFAWLWGRGLEAALRNRGISWAVGAAVLVGLNLLFLSQLGPAFAKRTAVPVSSMGSRYTEPFHGPSLGENALLLPQTRHEMSSRRGEHLRRHLSKTS